jgi:hypothetical protein
MICNLQILSVSAFDLKDRDQHDTTLPNGAVCYTETEAVNTYTINARMKVGARDFYYLSCSMRAGPPKLNIEDLCLSVLRTAKTVVQA